MADPIHETLLTFTDTAMEKLTELANRLYAVEKLVDGIVKNHAGDTRDELKSRIEELEKKFHTHIQETKTIPYSGPTYRG